MEMIGIDLWAKSYVVLNNDCVICTENTIDYIKEQMAQQSEITLTIATWVKDITTIVKKTDIQGYYRKEEKKLVTMP